MNHKFLSIALGVMLIAGVSKANAQTNYPNQVVRMIVTTAPGGGLDSFARMVAKELSARAGQQFIVDNRAGAATTIGATAAARAQPDGYTILMNTAAHTITPAIFRKNPTTRYAISRPSRSAWRHPTPWWSIHPCPQNPCVN